MSVVTFEDRMNHKLLENYDLNAFDVLMAMTRKRTLSSLVAFSYIKAELCAGLIHSVVRYVTVNYSTSS
jgi:hypothetical protein